MKKITLKRWVLLQGARGLVRIKKYDADKDRIQSLWETSMWLWPAPDSSTSYILPTIITRDTRLFVMESRHWWWEENR